jgi:DNA invertase Pin-like site-specific DNA recombinase
MKVAIYARVSKEEEGLQDPDNQLIPLRKFCKGMEWTIKAEYIDRASGGNSNRPEFQKMLGHVRQKHYDIILVWALDRFSREGISQTLGYIEQLKRYNTGLKSLQETWLDTSQPGVAELLLSIMAWMAAEERRKISERTKAALAKLKKQGKKLGRPKKNAHNN